MRGNKNRFGMLLVSVALCGALHAQDAGWSLGAAINAAGPDVSDYTGKHYGGTVEAGYSWNNSWAELPLRVSLGYSLFPGSNYGRIAGAGLSTYKINLENIQVGLDAYAKLPTEKVKLYFGLTLNKWHVKSESQYFLPDESPTGGHYEQGSVSRSLPSIKLGCRLGLDLPITEHLTGLAVFQLSELGTASAFMVQQDPSWAPDSGNQGVNPSWLGLGVRYRF